MNEHDRENLNFLLNSDEETLREWYGRVEADDIEYASEIMARYKDELNLRKRFDDADNIEAGDPTPDAENYLLRFRLKK